MRPEPTLAALLEEERSLILAGAWEDLEALAARKEAGLAALAAKGEDRLAPLAAELARNQALLAAAIEGLREAGRRRVALASSRARLVTYDAQGARAELPMASPRVERRA